MGIGRPFHVRQGYKHSEITARATLAQMEMPDLLFGVATSDHQAEAFDPNGYDCRDEWEKRPGQTARGRATDFWNRYSEDIRLARALGCKIFRFSMSWARVEK